MNKPVRAVQAAPHKAREARRALPGSWRSAAGMMRKHKRGMERYIASVRKEWR